MAAVHLTGWTEAVTVIEKQNLAIRGAQIVDEIASIKGQAKRNNVYQHPNSPRPNPIPIHITKPIVSTSTLPVPMEIDAIATKDNRRNPFPAIRSICIKDGLCFRCLQKYDVKTHFVNGECHCPNKNASFAEKMALLTAKKSKDPILHQIAVISTGSDTDEQDLQALEELNEDEADLVKWTVEEYFEGLSDVEYPPTSDLITRTVWNS